MGLRKWTLPSRNFKDMLVMEWNQHVLRLPPVLFASIHGKSYFFFFFFFNIFIFNNNRVGVDEVESCAEISTRTGITVNNIFDIEEANEIAADDRVAYCGSPTDTEYPMFTMLHTNIPSDNVEPICTNTSTLPIVTTYEEIEFLTTRNYKKYFCNKRSTTSPTTV